MIRIESGVHTGIEDIHCVIPKRIFDTAKM